MNIYVPGRLNEYRGCVYRTRSRILHHFNLHHTTRSGPLIDEDGDGEWLIKCTWCGLRMTEPLDKWAKIRRECAGRDASDAVTGRDPW